MKYLILCSLLLVVLVGSPASLLAKDSSSKGADLVARAMPVVTPEQFRQVLVKEFHERYSLENVELAVRVLFPKKPITIPSGNLRMKLVRNPTGIRTGRRAFRFGLHVDNQLIKTVNIVAEVAAKTDVVTPIHWIKNADIVQAEDLSVTKVDLPSLGHAFIRDPFLAVGKKALRPLPPHRPILQNFLTSPPVIRKGDRVIIEARQGGLVVQTVGLAKASGKPGETIPVLNRNSGREVLGTVLRPGLVEVLF